MLAPSGMKGLLGEGSAVFIHADEEGVHLSEMLATSTYTQCSRPTQE